jgi:hypothetical protein
MLKINVGKNKKPWEKKKRKKSIKNCKTLISFRRKPVAANSE